MESVEEDKQKSALDMNEYLEHIATLIDPELNIKQKSEQVDSYVVLLKKFMKTQEMSQERVDDYMKAVRLCKLLIDVENILKSDHSVEDKVIMGGRKIREFDELKHQITLPQTLPVYEYMLKYQNQLTDMVVAHKQQEFETLTKKIDETIKTYKKALEDLESTGDHGKEGQNTLDRAKETVYKHIIDVSKLKNFLRQHYSALVKDKVQKQLQDINTTFTKLMNEIPDEFNSSLTLPETGQPLPPPPPQRAGTSPLLPTTPKTESLSRARTVRFDLNDT